MKRFAFGGKRMRRIGIVALARKLLVALWKYLEKGIIPEGATLKAKENYFFEKNIHVGETSAPTPGLKEPFL
jgi:hypothetical protein